MIRDLTLADLSSSGLLAITVILILTGFLVPRRALKDKEAEADRWRKAYESERTARGIADAQIDELLEVGRTTRDFIAGVHSAAERRRQTGDPNASVET